MKLDKITQSKQQVALLDNKKHIAVYENQHYLWLQFGEVIQSLMLKRKPERLCLLYQQMLAVVHIHFSPKKILECGLGGGNITRFLSHKTPQTVISSVEPLSTVIDCYHQYFNPLKASHSIEVNRAEFVINHLTNHSLDWLILDVFQAGFDDGNSTQLYNETFFQTAANKLTQNAWLSINLPNISEPDIIELLSGLRTIFHDNIWIAKVPACKNIIVHALKQNKAIGLTTQNIDATTIQLKTNRLWRQFKQII